MASSNGLIPSACRIALVLCTLPIGGCFAAVDSAGGGEIKSPAGRRINSADVAVPAGYEIRAIARGLTYPTGVAFDDSGALYVIESGYAYGEDFGTSRLMRVRPGPYQVIATSQNGPWNGLAFHGGAFYVAEGGVREGGRILRVRPNGEVKPLVEGLPSKGDHHTNGPVIRDGYLYFSQGTATNAAIVGEDNANFGWLKRFPDMHDIPCRDVVLSGANVESANPLTPDEDDRAQTGAYLPFGTPSQANQVIKGQVPCSGAIFRIPIDGGNVELVAWGFRNPFGLAFAPDGTLYTTDNGYDVRGSRPVFGSADMLWQVKPGTWYGWPDFSEGRPVYENALWGDHFRAPGKPAPLRLLARHPNPAPQPAAFFPVHASADGIDFSRSQRFGFVGEAFVAEFGDQSPATGKSMAPVGFKVVRVDVQRGVISDFAVNRGDENGPASKLGHGGLERPVAVHFDPAGGELYVVDFGVLVMAGDSSKPERQTGVIWVIRRTGRGS